MSAPPVSAPPAGGPVSGPGRGTLGAPDRRRLVPTVGQRLVLAVAPALLAVVLVVALSYYGEIGRQAPGLVVAGSAALALVSLFVTWRNVGYVRRRLERLAGAPSDAPGAAAGTPDELDRIEQTVDRLGSALSASEAERARQASTAEARVRDAAELIAAAAGDAVRRLDDVRLPLHILLDTHFGELTPNQEELLADARDAALAADAALRRLRALADADRGSLVVQRDWVALADVLGGVIPAAQARAERRGGRLTVEVEPALPRVIADRVRLAEALAMLLGGAALPDLPPGSAKPTADSQRLRAERAAAGVVLTLEPVPDRADRVLAQRLLIAQGARVEETDAGLRITLASP